MSFAHVENEVMQYTSTCKYYLQKDPLPPYLLCVQIEIVLRLRLKLVHSWIKLVELSIPSTKLHYIKHRICEFGLSF